MHPLPNQAPGKDLQLFQFMPHLEIFLLAVEIRSLQFFGGWQMGFPEKLQFLLGFLLQEIQLKGEDLQGSVHLVHDAQTTAAHAGMAIVAHQLFKAPFQGFIVRGIIRGQS
jgi:hypothetical protein